MMRMRMTSSRIPRTAGATIRTMVGSMFSTMSVRVVDGEGVLVVMREEGEGE